LPPIRAVFSRVWRSEAQTEKHPKGIFLTSQRRSEAFAERYPVYVSLCLHFLTMCGTIQV